MTTDQRRPCAECVHNTPPESVDRQCSAGWYRRNGEVALLDESHPCRGFTPVPPTPADDGLAEVIRLIDRYGAAGVDAECTNGDRRIARAAAIAGIKGTVGEREMTTNVKIEAHCLSGVQVEVVVKDGPTTVELFRLDDGETAERVIYADREVHVREVRAVRKP